MANDHIETVGTARYDIREKLRRLPRNAEALAAETQKLKDLRDDLRSRAENQARQTSWVISNQLSGWMTDVERLGASAEEFKTSFENRLSSRLVTRYNLADNVVDLLQEVARLIDQGNLLSDRNFLLQPQQPDAVQHVSSATLVGAKVPLQQIKDSTRSDARRTRKQMLTKVWDHTLGSVAMDSDVVVKVDARRSWKERLTKVWDRASGSVASLILLSRNAEELGEEMAKLKELRDDLNDNRLQPAHQLRDTGQVENQLLGWMNRVDGATLDVASFQRLFEGHSYISRFGLGSTAGELLIRVRRLASEGNRLFRDQLRSLESSEDDIESLGRQVEAVASVPSDTSSSSLVGATERLQGIKQYIQDDRVGVIGIYGMGGTGKTALLKIINNEFLMEEARRSKFDVAIWVTVSREAIDIASIQKVVASRLGLPSDAQAKDLFQDLSEKRFILLLDDVWETPDLLEIGIPIPKTLKTRSKILFTTRSQEICGQMDADVLVKVGPLDQHSSWELFCSAFGRYASIHVLDKVGDLAKKAVAKCGGLPISLITVGSAMAQAETTDDWQDAITKMRHRPAEFSEGMRKDVLQSLKYSFEVLRSKTLQDCLLYFSLFPEGTYIEKKQIVDYWICEEFLDFKDFIELDIDDTRRRARKMIIELQNACLLEVDDERPQNLRLHDTVRDMALWITKEEFVVLAGSDCNASHVPKLAIWKKATRISLIDNKQVEEPPSPCWDLNCPNLTTLLLQNSRLGYNVARNQGFLTRSNMPALRVLDLSDVHLKELPIGITSLISLQFLSLRRNRLTSIPVELGKLVNLRQLDLSGNNNLQPIPREALSRLSSLQVLNLRSLYYDSLQPITREALSLPSDFKVHNLRYDSLQRSELVDLETLSRLGELHLRGKGVCSWELLQVIVGSPVLRRCIREIEVRFDDVFLRPPPKGETISQVIRCLSERINSLGLRANTDNPVTGELELYSGRLQHLEVLSIAYFIKAKISVIREGAAPSLTKLRNVKILGCGCSDLTWTGRLPCLVSLKVEYCINLTEILLSDGNKDDTDDQTVGSFFPKLQKMELVNLPSLRSMHTLILPSLEELIVNRCPELRQLSLNGGLPCFPKLRILQIRNCGCYDLTWTGRLPCLESLKVKYCRKLTEILLSDGNKDDTDDQTVGSFFPKLKEMSLQDLRSLRSISTCTLLLPFLEELYVERCSELWRLPWNGRLPKLGVLEIKDCGCSDLTWTGRIPCLEELKVLGCEELTEILLSDGNKDDTDDQTVGSFFPKLRKMTLVNLPSLRSISKHTLLLPSLKELIVNGCPELGQLPFSGDSAPNIWSIEGSKTWWNRLEWEEITIKERFGSKFEDSVW